MKQRLRSRFQQSSASRVFRVAWGKLILLLLVPALVSSCSRTNEAELLIWIESALTSDQPAIAQEAIAKIVEAKPDPSWIASQLRQGLSYEQAPAGWTVNWRRCLDGVDRAFHVYIPPGYDPSVPAIVLFDLHGGRMGAAVPPEEHFLARTIWQSSADRLDMILVYPQADAGATWFDEVGKENLHGQLRYLKLHYNVDENRVFMSGYSAGGAGTMWQAFHFPTPWAGFLVFSGYYDIGGLGPYPAFVRNLFSRPFRATSGLYDGSIPIDTVEPFITQYQKLGVDLAWQVYPVAHNVSFVDAERPSMEAFALENTRAPHRNEITWETASTDTGRCDWVRIEEIADVGNNADFDDLNVYLGDEETTLGVALAYQSDGSYRVAGTLVGSIAQRLGIQTGDQVQVIDGALVRTASDMDAVVAKKSPGESITVEITRDDTVLSLAGTLPHADPAYPVPSGAAAIHARSTGNSIDVRVRHVARFTLLLSGQQFDLSAPLIVRVNGQTQFEGRVQRDVQRMLEQAVSDLDRTAVYEALLTLEVDRASETQPP